MSAIPQLAGGVMLLCACSLLSQARLVRMITLYRLQSVALTAAALAQALAQRDAALYLAALIILCLNVLLLPNALRRIVGRIPATNATPRALTLALCIGLLGVALLAVPPMPLRLMLAVSLAVALLGLLLLAQRNPISQLIGFLSLANGLMLAAIAMPKLPFVAWLAAALPALGLSLLSLVLLRMQEQP